MNANEIEELYVSDARICEGLSMMTSNDAADFVQAHRHVRVFVACDLWDMVTPIGRSVMLNDDQLHVRSAALISARAVVAGVS